MPFDALLTFAVIALTVVLMAQEFLSPDYLLLAALLVLAVAGVMEPEEALSGFSNPALATIGGLFLVAAGVRATGVIDRVAETMFGGASLRAVLALASAQGLDPRPLELTATVAVAVIRLAWPL